MSYCEKFAYQKIQQTKEKVPYYHFTKENGLLNNEFSGSYNSDCNILAFATLVKTVLLPIPLKSIIIVIWS